MDPMLIGICMGIALLGVLLSAPLSFVPGLHVYNVIGIVVLLYLPLSTTVPPIYMIMFMFGLLVGYSVMNTISSVYLSAPDDSTIYIVMPAQKYLLQGRGHEAVLLSAIGSIAAIFFLTLFIPLFMEQLRILRELLTPHLFWILGLVSVYIIMSEWPKDPGVAPSPLWRFLGAWKQIGAGILTFFLSGFLGLIISYSQFIPPERAFQTLMPAFVGLFAVPMVITNILSGIELPKQYVSKSVNVSPTIIARGSAAGMVGGLFGAFFPAVTGGIAGMLAGQATVQRDDRMFIISQGASKVVYYVGAALLLFVPGVQLARGTMATMINMFYLPETMEEFLLVLAVIAITGAVAYLLLIQLSKLAIKLISRIHYRKISIAVLIILHIVVVSVTFWQGLVIMWIGAMIGMIPVMFHSRRMTCMGILLVPLMLNLAGLGGAIASVLGLI